MIGRLEITVKINQLPSAIVVGRLYQFEIDCLGLIVQVNVKPKTWKKMEQAAANYPQWVAAISGKLGEQTDQGFVLQQPGVQVFEKKAKTPKEETSTEITETTETT
ncbi:MAG: fertility inhibition FinO-like protein [Symploca sp. SIO1C4]|uniref:Fertility inhibition FinO-like protein n=1 Tax=Symploca sp. SIO1C4 TaxID=2607765 RepID=A0A6B3NCA0_9CYAN|nr:fertility inhibition FinO-like protein [Symploca sp. SIO1C4]